MTELYKHKFFSAIFPLPSGVMVSTSVKGARGPGFKSRLSPPAQHPPGAVFAGARRHFYVGITVLDAE